MRLINQLNVAQRAVIVVAIGVALATFGHYLISLGNRRLGWYAYAPLTANVGPRGTGLPGWVRQIIWLALTAVWAVASIIALRPAHSAPAEPDAGR
ncbi:MAG: hypothetical protein ACR2FU_14990 [Streptosporangiaceae bacterium]